MDSRLIFLHSPGGAMEGRRELSWPAAGYAGPRAQDVRAANPPGTKSEALRDAESSDEADQPMLHCQENLLSVDARESVPQTDTGR